VRIVNIRISFFTQEGNTLESTSFIGNPIRAVLKIPPAHP